MTENRKWDEIFANSAGAGYIIGAIADWGYYIAIGWPAENANDVVSPFFFGFIMSFFWPLHLIVVGWKWLLT